MSGNRESCSEREVDRYSKKSSKKARNMDCSKLRDEIERLMDSEKRGWEKGTKGLIQRFRDYKGDDATHHINICNDQRALRSYLREYQSKGCGDPPSGAEELAERKLPVVAEDKSQEESSDLARDVAVVGGGVALVYIAYRIIRFLPSLAPPLWPTIPANLAIP